MSKRPNQFYHKKLYLIKEKDLGAACAGVGTHHQSWSWARESGSLKGALQNPTGNAAPFWHLREGK